MLCPYISSVRYARYSHTSRLCQSRPCPTTLAARPRTCASADAPPGKLAVRPRTRASAVARHRQCFQYCLVVLHSTVVAHASSDASPSTPQYTQATTLVLTTT